MQNLLQVSHYFDDHCGGLEIVAAEIAKRSQETYHVTWVACGKQQQEPYKKALPFWDFLEKKTGLPMPLIGGKAINTLRKEVKKAHIVHVHDFLYITSLWAVFWAVLYKKPILLTQHIGLITFRSQAKTTLLRLFNRLLGPIVMRFVSQVVFVSKTVAMQFSGIKLKEPPIILMNGLNHSLFKPAFTQTHHEKSLVLFVGRFVEKKGIHLISALVEKLNCNWNLLGSGPYKIPLHPRVTVCGSLPQSETIPYYQTADLLVLPSTGEGFPLVVQEALACGTPVLVSQEVKEAFLECDDRCVFSVELRCDHPEKALHDKLTEILQDPEKLKAARPFAHSLSQQWSWEKTIQAYHTLYQKLLTPSA